MPRKVATSQQKAGRKKTTANIGVNKASSANILEEENIQHARDESGIHTVCVGEERLKVQCAGFSDTHSSEPVFDLSALGYWSNMADSF